MDRVRSFRGLAHNHIDIVRLILSRSDADPNLCRCQTDSPLHAAARHGHREPVQVLLADSRTVSQMPGPGGLTALDVALENEHEDVAYEFMMSASVRTMPATH